MNKNILITGGAGFIGSALIRHIIKCSSHKVFNLDKLTYASNLKSLDNVKSSTRYQFINEDVCNIEGVKQVFKNFKPDIVMHLAAESHVDKSINEPASFIKTNILGTYYLLETAKEYWESLKKEKKDNFRFHHISTDEVYGDLGDEKILFCENSSYKPSSPYSASKASSDHLVRSWNRTFGLPILITNCSNNYGPFQFPEKLIPHMLLCALTGKEMPVYGNGLQVRDWLYVDDHATALLKVALEANVGETYNIGGNNQITNIQVVHAICELLENMVPIKLKNIKRYEDLITFVKDRPGHDSRYAIDTKKIEKDLGWLPAHSFENGLKKTISWYLTNNSWFEGFFNGNSNLNRIKLER